MSFIRAFVVGSFVTALVLAVQRLDPAHLEAPFVAFALSLMVASGVPCTAWPVLMAAYLAPALACGFVVAMLSLIYDAATWAPSD